MHTNHQPALGARNKPVRPGLRWARAQTACSRLAALMQQAQADMELPAGWIWVAPAPAGCIIYTALLECFPVTNIVPIPATH
jgi:hypothetical protein